jgi:hypothetical protein
MSFIRLGFTESILLLYYYLDLQQIDNSQYISSQNNFINWLYTTSGFYDKNIGGSFFNFDGHKIRRSEVYNNYFNRLLNSLKNNDAKLLILSTEVHLNVHDSLTPYRNEFLNYIDYHNKYNRNLKIDPNNINNPGEQCDFYRFIDNKNVLIINNLGSLMKLQYESGNLKKIFPDFPMIKNIDFLEPGYTFFNNGPDSSILDTAEKLCDKVKCFNFNYDCVLVSAGAYSCLLFDYIINELHKDVFVIGGDLAYHFGIMTNRIRSQGFPINEYFINVPDEMKPPGYEKIEGGCYW